MTGFSTDVLDAVAWDRFASGAGPLSEEYPVSEVPRALRRLARPGGAGKDGDRDTLGICLGLWSGEVTPAATAALPFMMALAGDPAVGERVALLEMLVTLVGTAARAEPARVAGEWPEVWLRHRGAVRALLADPDPEVRREALPLADGIELLLERWTAETDPAVRLPVLLALGEAAAGAAAAEAAVGRGTGSAEGVTGAAGAGLLAVERVRAVLAGVLRDGSPVMKVAAVWSCAYLDPDVPLHHFELLLEILSDPATEPEFEAAWQLPGCELPCSREDIVRQVADRFGHACAAAASFAARLAAGAGRSGDAVLCRAALHAAWRLLVLRPSVAPVLLPVAGGLLGDPDDAVRLKAAHLLAVLGPPAAPYADRLAALVDDLGEDTVDYTEGTVGVYARWALARIGDPRALPGLVEQLHEPYLEEYGRGWFGGDPRLPEIDEVLTPLRAHADVLLPSLRESMRHEAGRGNGHGHGTMTGMFLRVLEAWGPDALPALPEVVPLLEGEGHSATAAAVIAAMGPSAASAADALRASAVHANPMKRRNVALALWRTGGDSAPALRLIGDEVRAAAAPHFGPVHLLAGFGPAAAPYADRVRCALESGPDWVRIQAAITLWAITGEPEPSASVLEEYVLPMADGGDGYGSLVHALRGLARIGRLGPAARAALRRVEGSDRRLSTHVDYQAFLEDEALRALIGEVLALPDEG
ncbi:HEAT repeat domain-containing protein [Streptomyces sp. 4.24]|uniref:HEAT repeat domain-containing protein n=1 Tax=Streptomyces tritrimontium TaxID=3406573 RepID=UPI003BB723C2